MYEFEIEYVASSGFNRYPGKRTIRCNYKEESEVADIARRRIFALGNSRCDASRSNRRTRREKMLEPEDVAKQIREMCLRELASFALTELLYRFQAQTKEAVQAECAPECSVALSLRHHRSLSQEQNISTPERAFHSRKVDELRSQIESMIAEASVKGQ